MHIKEKKEWPIILLISLIIFLVGVFITIGFSEKPYTIIGCESEVSKYVLGEFSDDDYDEFWTEPASEVYTATATNEIVEYPPMPEITANFSSWTFDGYKEVTETYFEVYTQEGEWFSDPISNASACIGRLNSVSYIKTWYGKPYGI
jgi:hypothetical protein